MAQHADADTSRLQVMLRLLKLARQADVQAETAVFELLANLRLGSHRLTEAHTSIDLGQLLTEKMRWFLEAEL